MAAEVDKRRVERAMARVCLWSLAATLLVSFFPDGLFSSRFIVVGVTAVAVILLASWIFLMANHIRNFFFEKPSRYTIGQILVVLFIPIVGAIIISLQKTAISSA